MKRIILLSLFLSCVTPAAYAAFTSPIPNISATGSYTVSWSDTPVNSGDVSQFNNVPLFTLTEQKLNSGIAPKAFVLQSTQVSISGKTPGQYEYVYTVRYCSSSGCAYFSPPGSRMTVTVGAEAQVVTPPAEAVTLAGSTPYTAGVSGKGEAIISVPIKIPQGINGMQPHISLNYNSSGTAARKETQSASGILGYGWSVSGLSDIRRCTMGQADRYTTNDPYNVMSGTRLYRPWLTYTATDSLCLDGQLLVLVGGVHFQPGAEYRTYTESFKRITLQGTVAEPWFRVENPNGSVAIYGSYASTRIKKIAAPGGTEKTPYFQWPIEKEMDRYGNNINYFYTPKDESFSYFVNKNRSAIHYISYNGPSQNYNVSFRYVTMPWAPLETPSTTYDSDYPPGVIDRYNFTRDASKQLSAIAVRAASSGGTGDETTYSISGSGQTDDDIRAAGLRVDKIQECYINPQNSQKCLNPLTFNWSAGYGFKNWQGGIWYKSMEESVANQAGYIFLWHIRDVVDSLGATTSFYFYKEKFEKFGFVEDPFPKPPGDTKDWPGNKDSGGSGGSVSLGYDAQPQRVVTQLDRSTALAPNDIHTTRYTYQARILWNPVTATNVPYVIGSNSNYGLGFLGFTAVRIIDDATGAVTYNQYGMPLLYDKMIAPKLAASYQYTGIYGEAATQPLAKMEMYNESTLIGHGAFGKTSLPTVKQITNYAYENGVFLGATIKTNTYDIPDGFITRITTSVSNGSALESTPYKATQGWGSAALYNLAAGSVKTTRVTTTNFDNVFTTADWRIGFTTNKVEQFYNGSTSNYTDLKTQTSSYVPVPGKMAIQSVTRFAGDANNELTQAYEYDAGGHQTLVTTSGAYIDTRSTKAEYDLSYGSGSNVIPNKITNALGHVTTSSDFDLHYDQPQTMTDANGIVTRQTYDSLGRVTATDANGVTTTQAYIRCETVSCEAVPGKVGAVAPVYFKEVDSQVSPKTREYYDSRGRVIRSETEGFLASEWIRTDVQYNEQGRVYKSSLPYKVGATPQYATNTYDSLGRITNVLQPDGGSTSIVYDTATGSDGYSQLRTTSTELIKKADGSAAGSQQKISYVNSAGQLTKTIDAAGTTTSFEYDALGNVVKTTVNGGADGTTISTAVYDNAGNRTSITDPNAGTVASLFNALGQLRKITDNKGNVTTYTYDKLGRMLSSTSIDGTNNWVYDPVGAKGNLWYSTNNNGYTQTNFYQDPNRIARLSSVETTISGIPGVADKTYTDSITYDAYGRTQKTTPPSDFSTTQNYNAQGYPSQIRRGDNWYPLQTIQQVGVFGVEQEALPDGSTTQRSYDPKSGRISSIVNSRATVQNLTYQWRSNGSLESRVDTKPGSVITDNFQYDNLDRLTSTGTVMNGSTQRTLTQTYNNLGNLKSNTSSNVGDAQVTGYQYTGGRPHATSDVTINGAYTHLNYDANGAIINYFAPTPAQSKAIAYNAANQPTNITLGAGLTGANPIARDEFRYTPDGARYYKRSTYQEGSNQRVEHTFYIGNYETTYYDSFSTIKQSEKTQVGALLLNIRKTPYVGSMVETMEVLHRDHLGSVVAVTDANAPVIILAFEPFGGRRSTAIGSVQNITTTEMTGILGRSPALNSQGFTGHENLDRTGLIHMNGRVYDPQLGRFLSPDPIVQSPTNSQSWNRYSYVSNNPLKYTDPTGFCGEHISSKECDEGVEEVTTTGYRKSSSPPPCENCVDKGFMDNSGGGFGGSNGLPPASASGFAPVDMLPGAPVGGGGGASADSSITEDLQEANAPTTAYDSLDAARLAAASMLPKGKDKENGVVIYEIGNGKYGLSNVVKGKSAITNFTMARDKDGTLRTAKGLYGVKGSFKIAELMHSHPTHGSSARFSGGKGAGDVYGAESLKLNSSLVYGNQLRLYVPQGLDISQRFEETSGVTICTGCF